MNSPTPSWRRTVTLRDGARVTLRPIAVDDKPRLAAMVERLSEESSYRRFFTSKTELSPAELDYLVDVDHCDHEAIVAIDASRGEALGARRITRSTLSRSTGTMPGPVSSAAVVYRPRKRRSPRTSLASKRFTPM